MKIVPIVTALSILCFALLGQAEEGIPVIEQVHYLNISVKEVVEDLNRKLEATGYTVELSLPPPPSVKIGTNVTLRTVAEKATAHYIHKNTLRPADLHSVSLNLQDVALDQLLLYIAEVAGPLEAKRDAKQFILMSTTPRTAVCREYRYMTPAQASNYVATAWCHVDFFEGIVPQNSVVKELPAQGLVVYVDTEAAHQEFIENLNVLLSAAEPQQTAPACSRE